MIELKQRFPNFFSGFTSQIYNFETLEELNLFIDNPPKKCFLNNWNKKPDFVRFELRPSAVKSSKQQYLMSVLEDSFWAIGYINER